MIFFSVNNVLREYDSMKEAIRNLNTSTVHQILIYLKFTKNTESKKPKVAKTNNGTLMQNVQCSVWQQKDKINQKSRS